MYRHLGMFLGIYDKKRGVIFPSLYYYYSGASCVISTTILPDLVKTIG
jgi:hypothetical protein